MALLLRTDCLETIEKEQVAKTLLPICGTSGDMSSKNDNILFPCQQHHQHSSSVVPKNKHHREKLGIFERLTKDLPSQWNKS